MAAAAYISDRSTAHPLVGTCSAGQCDAFPLFSHYVSQLPSVSAALAACGVIAFLLSTTSDSSIVGHSLVFGMRGMLCVGLIVIVRTDLGGVLCHIAGRGFGVTTDFS